MNKVKLFFKWLFKSDYGSDIYPVFNCDVPETGYDSKGNEFVLSEEFVKRCQDSIDSPSVIGKDMAPMPTIEEQDHQFYELIDPKGCRVEIYKDRKKEWRWRFFSANNKILACSGEGYKRKASMRKSLNTVREVIPFVPIEET